MPRFSANLGFLWADCDLPEAVQAASKAGFDAVECHWPFETPPHVLREVLHETGLPLLGLNTRRGDVAKSDFGLTALPGRECEARDAIREALDYAAETDAQAVHVMAGKAEGKEAEKVFCDNLAYACSRAAGRTILIEPINDTDVPGYFLTTVAQANRILDRVAAPNLRIMFDCYHAARMGECVFSCVEKFLPVIGHIQFASVPDRGTPDRGVIDYERLFQRLDALGWNRPLGAEYLPRGCSNASLGWFSKYKSR